MEAAFLRSEKVHAESIAKMMTTMSTEKAWNVLAKNNLTNPALVEVAVSAVKALVGVVGALQPQQMLPEADDDSPLESLLRSVAAQGHP